MAGEVPAPEYKLTYYPSEALGESIRFLFSYAGIEFEDFRFERPNWPKLKPNFPFGQVPALEHKGKMTHQSVAISRYVAKKAKLMGNSDWEDLEIDAIVDTVTDLRIKISFWYYQTDTTIRDKLKEPLFKETIPYCLSRLDEIAKENNGYLAVGRLTWADLNFVSLLKYLGNMCIGDGGDLVENYPNLVALRKTVFELPAIKAWVAKRPQNDF